MGSPRPAPGTWSARAGASRQWGRGAAWDAEKGSRPPRLRGADCAGSGTGATTARRPEGGERSPGCTLPRSTCAAKACLLPHFKTVYGAALRRLFTLRGPLISSPKRPPSPAVPLPPPRRPQWARPPPCGLRRWFGGPLPSPVSLVGAAATPGSDLSAPQPSRRPLLSSHRPALPRGTTAPTFPLALFCPGRAAAAAAAAAGGGARRRRWPGSPWRTVKEAAKKKSATTTTVSCGAGVRVGARAGRWVPRPPSRVGAGAEGWEGGGTDIWPHLNPFPARRG